MTTPLTKEQIKTAADRAEARMRGDGAAITPKDYVEATLIEWPDVTKKGAPKRTYRNTREAINAFNRAVGTLRLWPLFAAPDNQEPSLTKSWFWRGWKGP